jgi:hypothetical protein
MWLGSTTSRLVSPTVQYHTVLRQKLRALSCLACGAQPSSAITPSIQPCSGCLIAAKYTRIMTTPYGAETTAPYWCGPT